MDPGLSDNPGIGRRSEWVKGLTATSVAQCRSAVDRWCHRWGDTPTDPISRLPGIRDCPEEGPAGPQAWRRNSEMGRERLEG